MKSLENNFEEFDSAFESLLENFEKDYEGEAKLLASKLLSGIKDITDRRNMNRKDVAHLIETSASYLTQLYRGSKLLNFNTLAKLVIELGLNIEFKVTEKEYSKTINNYDYLEHLRKVNIEGKTNSWKVLRSIGETNDKSTFSKEVSQSLKVIKQKIIA